MAKTPEEMTNEELLNAFAEQAILISTPPLCYRAHGRELHNSLRAKVLKLMEPATPAPIAAQTEKKRRHFAVAGSPEDGDCCVVTGCHKRHRDATVHIQPEELQKPVAAPTEQVDAARLREIVEAAQVYRYQKNWIWNDERVAHFVMSRAVSLKQETQPPRCVPKASEGIATRPTSKGFIPSNNISELASSSPLETPAPQTLPNGAK